MGLGLTRAVGLLGIEGLAVHVEADVAAGLPSFTVSGRPDASCRQSPDRIRAAAANSGHPIPQRRITVNLSPASVPKVGSGFDLSIAVAVLVASGAIPGHLVERVAHLGELGLDGSVRPIRGVLALVLEAARSGVRHVVVPVANAAEARLIRSVRVHPVAHLAELVRRYQLMGGGRTPDEVADVPTVRAEPEAVPDLVDVIGQHEPRRALEIAAAGGHHLYLVGPPGAGKTMLAERLAGLLPALDDEQAMEVTAIASIMGTLGDQTCLQRRPPFVAPHHGASMPAVIGGGSGHIHPGAITQAHHGVLFIDEAPEFKPQVMQALRQPVESGSVVIARASGRVRYPCRFQLVLAANPCPCGMGFGKGVGCSCPPQRRRTYLGKLVGPLLDRIDLQVFVPAPSRATLVMEAGESTAEVAARVQVARARQAERWAGCDWRLNGHAPGTVFRRGRQRLPRTTTTDLDFAIDAGMISMRGYDRCLKLAWTISDLGAGGVPTRDDVGLALSLRQHVAVAA